MSFVQLRVICGKFLLAADGDAWLAPGREGEPTACGPLPDSLSAGDRRELATLRPQPVSWVTLYHTAKVFPGLPFPNGVPHRETEHLPVQVFAADIAQQPYDAAPTEAPHLISYDTGALIRLGPEGATLPDLLAGWQSLLVPALEAFTWPSTVTARSRERNSRSNARLYFSGSRTWTALIKTTLNSSRTGSAYMAATSSPIGCA